MQKQLIPVIAGHIGDIETLTVNARDLHQFLQLRSQFGTWMQNRIRQYGFTAGVDFASFNKKIKRANGGGTFTVDYTLTLDMGKELAMVERNDKGREARRYFIDCEKRLLARYSTLPRLGQADALRLKRVAEALAGELLRVKPERRKLLRYRKMDLSVREIGQLMGMGTETVRREIGLMEACGLLEVTPKLEMQRAVGLANLPRKGGAA